MQFAEAKPLEVILNEIVARLRQFTNADGAAVAIRDGDFVVTRATAGEIAPDLGSRMTIQGSFTGLCMEQRTMLHCQDSDADARVDAKVCRQLNTRSFVVVPIEGARQPQGVLAAFSSAPHAFTRTDIAVLKTTADQIRHALANVPAADPVPFLSAEPAPAEKKAQPQLVAPLKAVPAATQVAPVIPASNAVTPSSAPLADRTAPPVKAEERTAVVATLARTSVQATASPTSKPLAAELVPLAEFVDAPAKPEPEALNETLPDGFREQYLGWKGFETPEPAPGISRKWFVMAAAACILLVVIVAFVMRLTSPVLRTSAAGMPNASAVRATGAAAAIPVPIQPSPVAVALPASTSAEKARQAVLEPASAAPKTTPAAKKPAMVIESSSLPARAPAVPEADAPQITIASSSSALLPDMKQSVPNAPKPLAPKVSDVEPSELTHKVMPQFPKFTSAQPGTQTVVLRARVLADGSVGDMQVLQGRAEFGESAKAAVKQWHYKPARVDGKPIETSVTVTLNFRR